ncbi:DnaB-like helicase C-terminal domain-containing protein [Bacillus velezensis]|uniref:DnaB-like helicase C-terminal domain-containing protein n=1 Tax=Bacillus velezensis TaxID=492670 RepID=UPI003342229E
MPKVKNTWPACVIAFSQLSRGVQQRQDRQPIISDIRELGQFNRARISLVFFIGMIITTKKANAKILLWIIIGKQRKRTCRNCFTGVHQRVRTFCQLEAAC